jgi:hypothetical protein
LYGLEDEWILCPPGMLGDQLAVQSFVTVMLQAAFSPDGLQFATGETLDVQSLQTGIRVSAGSVRWAIRLSYDRYRRLRYP